MNLLESESRRIAIILGIVVIAFLNACGASATSTAVPVDSEALTMNAVGTDMARTPTIEISATPIPSRTPNVAGTEVQAIAGTPQPTTCPPLEAIATAVAEIQAKPAEEQEDYSAILEALERCLEVTVVPTQQ